MDVDAGSGLQGGALLPVAFVHFLVRGIYGGGFWGVIALYALFLDGEGVGNPLRPLCHRELLEGGRGVPGVHDGRVVEVEEVDGGLDGGGPGLWRLVPSALAPSGRGTGARGLFAWWWALG